MKPTDWDPDFWRVSDADEDIGFLQLVVSGLAFALFLIAILFVGTFAWAAQ
jgi:hypothetical protein